MSNDPAFELRLKHWRHAFHRHPETGFEEFDTAEQVASILASLGLEVHRGIGGTGLVASLTVGDGPGVIGLRADMDALNMEEINTFAHRSQTPGNSPMPSTPGASVLPSNSHCSPTQIPSSGAPRPIASPIASRQAASIARVRSKWPTPGTITAIARASASGESGV